MQTIQGQSCPTVYILRRIHTMAKLANEADTGSNVSNEERIDAIADAAQKIQGNNALQRIQGSNAFISDSVSAALNAQAQLDCQVNVATEAAAAGLGATVDSLVNDGHTSLDYSQAIAKDFTLGKDDPWFKKRKDFYDNAKACVVYGHVTAKDYGLPAKFLEKTEFYRIYRATKKALQNEGLQPVIHVALETAKSDANQTIRKIRERMITIEKADEVDTPKVESTDTEKNIKDFQRLINRVLSREDLDVDETESMVAILRLAADTFNIEADLKFDVE